MKPSTSPGVRSNVGMAKPSPAVRQTGNMRCLLVMGGVYRSSVPSGGTQVKYRCRCRDISYPWMDAARHRSLPGGIPPLNLIVLEDILLFVIQDIVLIVLVSILHWGIQCEDVVLLVVLPFIEAFQRRFEGLHIFLILLNILNILEGSWDARCCWLLISLRWSSP